MNRLRNLVIASSWALALALFWAHTACADTCAAHKGWIQKDARIIHQLKVAYRRSPLAILPLLHPDFSTRTDLGYGYSLVDGGIQGGCAISNAQIIYSTSDAQIVYTSIDAQIIYKGDKPVAYKLDPQTSFDDDATKAQYMVFYRGLFPVAHGHAMPLYYNKEMAEKPLDGCTVQMNATPEIKAYMTPFSGTDYGTTGGFADTPLQNREAYDSIKAHLDRRAHAYLLCSKNPATRLTAVEYFYVQRDTGRGFISPAIQARIAGIFAETPQIGTMIGDIGVSANSRDLVNKYARRRSLHWWGKWLLYIAGCGILIGGFYWVTIVFRKFRKSPPGAQ